MRPSLPTSSSAPSFRPSHAVLLALFAFACSSPEGSRLFAEGKMAAVSSAGSTGAPADVAGTSSGGITGSAGSSTTGGSVAGQEATAGTLAVGATGGSGGSGGGADSAGSGGQVQGVIESCDMIDGATTNETNGHCYRADAEPMTFAAAKEACALAGGHLVTISSDEENEFVAGLLEDEHWLGANDGKDDRSSGVGTYEWVTDEPWEYDAWQDGQPNAVATNCPDENSGSHCHEHCAYQVSSGGWIDRACFHTIAAVCEWEPVPPAEPDPAPGTE